MRVVGTVIVPPAPYLATGLGQGAVLAMEGYLRIDPGAARQRGGLPFLVRFAPGVSRDAGLAAVAKDIKSLPNPFVFGAERPANVLSLASIAGLPAALSGLLALMAAGFRAAGPDGRRDAGPHAWQLHPQKAPPAPRISDERQRKGYRSPTSAPHNGQRPHGQQAAQIGGSARGYQELSASSPGWQSPLQPVG